MRVGLEEMFSETPCAPPLLVPPAALWVLTAPAAVADSDAAFMVDWLLLLLAMVVAIFHQ